MATNRTFTMIKPEAVENGNTGDENAAIEADFFFGADERF